MEPQPNSTDRTLTLCASALLLSITIATGCSDSATDEPAESATQEVDSSYLDSLAESTAPDPEPEPVIEKNDDPIEIAQTATPQDEDREWTRERGSQSTLGRTRDRAKELTNRLQDGTTPGGGIADTYSDEEYASTSGYRWDMPEEWRMAVPVGNRFAEMYIKNQLGSASVSFTKESGQVSDILRELSSILVTDSGSRNRPKTSKKTILGLPVTVVDMNGTYIDPAGKGGSNESPFYAIHAVIFELPNTRVLINMWGPEDTVARSAAQFDVMIDKTSKD